MNAQVGHIQFNVRPDSLPFYKDLLTFAGWRTLFESPEMLGVGQANGSSLWFAACTKESNNDYDGLGMNHLALHVSSQAEVDEAAAYLAGRDIPALFETPRHRAEFSESEDHTYYQVMFESPDRILFEIVYIGPKAAK
ncbi:MAG: hypothetical protein OHK0022_06650 [Roseiflexaceae bacterium]